MKISPLSVVNIGLDAKALDTSSVVSSRIRAYGNILKYYSVITPAPVDATIDLSESTTVYGVAGINKISQLWGIYKIAVTLIKSGKCDVITSQDAYFLGFLAWVLAYWYNCGLEIQAHGVEKDTFLRSILAGFVFRKANSIRVVSSRLQQHLVHTYGLTEHKMSVVPVYVDVTSLEISQTQNVSAAYKEQFESLYKNNFNILSVCRLVSVKNISMQIRAVKELTKSVPNIVLHIVGDGPLFPVLQKEIDTLHLTEKVLLHGHQTGAKLGMFFTCCDCFVLTSNAEGYGMVVIEAATAGLPIVMTDVGCAGDVIIDGESGVVIPVGGFSAFTEALRRVISDEAFRSSIANGAREAVKKLPSFDEVIEKYLASWEKASNSRRLR